MELGRGMNNTSQAEKVASGRSATSCLECQRRKQKCSREWPCNHCQSRKVPHLCQFPSTNKVVAQENDLPTSISNVSRKRKGTSSQSHSFGFAAPDPDQGLSDGLAQLGYMTGHNFFNLAKPGIQPPTVRGPEAVTSQSEDIETALKTILPKPYTDVLVQNFLENANYQYYAIFPQQLRDQSTEWWETRAAGRRPSPELTCLLLRVCAVSTQYLEDSLRKRLEMELGEKAQSMTERFHAAAQRLRLSLPRGSRGVIHVQQLCLEASWWKSEANMVEAWHSLSIAIREAQELGMHKQSDHLPNFEREIRKRLWCILWTWDWQMSTLLSRPLLIDQDDHKLEIPDGRLEAITEPGAPHPLSSIALQASLCLSISHLFQRLNTDHSVELVLEIEAALEKWMATFPAAMRDHRPDTHWDQKLPNVPFMRSQVNVIAYSYLLAPLKPYLLGTADPEVLTTPLGAEIRLKGVDTCLDLMKAVKKFHDLIFPASIKYFYIIFFMFDAATVLCSAIVHDTTHTLPKRSQCLRSLRTAQELMDGVAHLSKSSRISAQLLRKLAATLALSPEEKQILGIGSPPPAVVRPSPGGDAPKTAADVHEDVAPLNAAGSIEIPTAQTSSSTPSSAAQNVGYDAVLQQPAVEHYCYAPTGYTSVPSSDWAFVDYSAMDGMLQDAGFGTGGPSLGLYAGAGEPMLMQPGDPLTGTYLDQVWDWDCLNMDLGQTQLEF